MIDEVIRNIDTEIRMARELYSFIDRYNNSQDSEKKIFLGVIKSLKKRIKLINNSIPMLMSSSYGNQLPTQKTPKNEIAEIKVDESLNKAVVQHKDREDFMNELNISEKLIKKLKKKSKKKVKKNKLRERSNTYGKLSNKFFFGVSNTWIKRGSFKSLRLNLIRSNMSILTTTYISMMLFSIILSLIIGFFLIIFLMFFTIGLEFPFIIFYSGGFFDRILQTFWIIFALPLVTFIGFYFFPGAERRSLEKKIDQELPFVVIHMGSISGSGIAPIEIFKILGLGKEYKHTKKEMMKIINQTNLYGYDLTTALRNVARATPSAKLSELLNGISITINSGGDIKRFFEKRAESLLLEYRLEREKYTKNAETFMDIYISVVIAAPMILLMLLIMIAVSGIGTGFTINELSFGVIGIVGILNIIFLTFLQLKQPSY